MTQLAATAFGNVDTGHGTTEAFVRRHPHTAAVSLTFDDEEWVEQALDLIGRHYLISHGSQLGLLLRKCPVAVVSTEHVGRWVADFEVGSRGGNRVLGHRLSGCA